MVDETACNIVNKFTKTVCAYFFKMATREATSAAICCVFDGISAKLFGEGLPAHIHFTLCPFLILSRIISAAFDLISDPRRESIEV